MISLAGVYETHIASGLGRSRKESDNEGKEERYSVN